MLTPEKIARHYRGPYRKPGETGFRWFQKGRRWPRLSYYLFFNPTSRVFHLHRFTRQSSKAIAVKQTITTTEPDMVEAFRDALPPADLAHCFARSLLEQTSPDTYRLTRGTSR